MKKVKSFRFIEKAIDYVNGQDHLTILHEWGRWRSIWVVYDVS